MKYEKLRLDWQVVVLGKINEIVLKKSKTEEKYTSGHLHEALEKRANKITRGYTVSTRKLSFNAGNLLRNFLPCILRSFLIFCVFVQVRTPLYTICLYFSFVFLRSGTYALRLRCRNRARGRGQI